MFGMHVWWANVWYAWGKGAIEILTELILDTEVSRGR